MAGLTREAEPVAAKLLKVSEAKLYEQLGILAKAIAVDPAKAGAFEPLVTYDEEKMGSKEDVREFGRRLFLRWNIEAYKLICGDELEDMIDRSELNKAFGISNEAVAAALSSLLISHMGLSPALAVVVASLVIKRFSKPGHGEFCQVWKERLPRYE